MIDTTKDMFVTSIRDGQEYVDVPATLALYAVTEAPLSRHKYSAVHYALHDVLQSEGWQQILDFPGWIDVQMDATWNVDHTDWTSGNLILQ